MKITIKTNEEAWTAARMLKASGYTKTDDCYWVEVWKKGDAEATIVREN